MDLQQEIETLKCDLQSNEQDGNRNIDHELSFLKQQVVELMMEKQKLLKKCNDMVCDDTM